MRQAIWLNHWFSTAYNIIQLIREDNDVYVIGSNENKYSPIKNVCDEWYVEPRLKGGEYIRYCLNFCSEHNVDVFIPRREMVCISEYKSEFEAVGVKVMVDEYDIIAVLNNKETTFDFFKENEIGEVPDYRIATTGKEFKDAVEALGVKYESVCFKFAKDEGGKSFRVIDDRRKGYSALFKKQNTRMTFKDAMDALNERDIVSPIMVMPFMSGDEVSVDCLNTDKGLIALPRVKGYEKYEVLRFDEEIIKTCEKFQKFSDLRHPYNVQFKYMNETPYVLEVNTRMSGGIHMACHASGVNIPKIAVGQLIGKAVDWKIDFQEKIISQVLQSVIMGGYE